MRALALRGAVVLTAVFTVTGLAACGSSGSGGDSSNGDSGAGSGGKRVGLVMSGPKNDGSYYQQVYQGFTAAAKAHGLTVSGVVDNSGDPQSTLQAIRNLAQASDLVVGGGGADINPSQQLGPQFGEVEFAVLGASNDSKVDNVHAYYGLESVDSYIAGLVAAGATKTGHVGFVAGGEVPATTASMKAFEMAVHAQDPSIKVSDTTAGSFTDPTKAKQAAAAEIAAGADVILAFVDGGTPGIAQAVEDSGKDVKIISIINARCDESDAYFATSIFQADEIVKAVIQDFLDDDLVSGTKYYSLEDPSIQRFEMCPKYETPERKKLIQTAVDKINAGKIEVPRG